MCSKYLMYFCDSIISAMHSIFNRILMKTATMYYYSQANPSLFMIMKSCDSS